MSAIIQTSPLEKLSQEPLPAGDATPFTRGGEVEAEWRIITPIEEAWAHLPVPVAMSCSKSEAILPNTGSTTATSARLATGHTSPRCSTSSPYCRRDPKDRCPYALSPHNSIVKPWIERQLPDLSVYLLSILAFVREPPQDEFLGQISSRSLSRLSQM